ncbi:MAG: MYG1 family protein [Oscillospiraceae bacterium]|nr:MYG1 family protein [Oscillospiraceae bacterium]
MLETNSLHFTENPKLATAVTHNGLFHGDEVMGTVILKKLGAVILMRTARVPDDIPDDEDVIVFDIGLGEYDHHQEGGNGKRENGVPYASCGLLWKAFGLDVIAILLDGKEYPFTHQELFAMIDQDIIQGIDAMDNGVVPKSGCPAKIMSLSTMVSSFNPTWDSSENFDKAFEKAVSFAETIFDNKFNEAIAKLKAVDILDNLITIAENGIVFLKRFIPWNEIIFDSSNPKAPEILFVVFPSPRLGYNCQCVPDALGSFGQRKPLPADWRGKSPEDLATLTGVADAIFCHPGGFICTALSAEGAIALAKLATNN